MATTLTKSQKLQEAQLRRSAKAREQRTKRDNRILSMRAKGKTLEDIAAAIGITHQRVGQIIKANAPKAP